MEQFHLAPTDLLMIDDMMLGCKMAKNAGVAAAFAGWSKEEFPELAVQMRQYCDFSFTSAKELEKFLFD